MKTLIVEDDFISRRFLQAILSPYGTCNVAVNGCEALEMANTAWEQEDPYNLICLDIMMPEMDGYQVLRELRRREEEMGIEPLNGVKVIVTTALSEPKNIMIAFKEQCQDYLIKPIEKAKLLEKIRSLGLIE